MKYCICISRYLCLMPVFHLKITVRPGQRVLLTQSRRFYFLLFSVCEPDYVDYVEKWKKVWYLHNNSPAGDITHQPGILSADKSSLLTDEGLTLVIQRINKKIIVTSSEVTVEGTPVTISVSRTNWTRSTRSILEPDSDLDEYGESSEPPTGLHTYIF